MIIKAVLILGLFNILMVYFTKHKFGEVFPLTLMLVTLLIYIGGLIIGSFTYGIIAIQIIALCAIPLLILKLRDKQFRNIVFSNGFWAVCIIFAICFIINWRRCVFAWDELSHWGKMIKEMIRLDQFYSVNDSDLLVHKAYPPFVTIFEMIFCRLTGGFSESRATMALHFFEFSCLVPWLVEKKVEKRSKNIVVLSTLVFLFIAEYILYFDVANTFSTLYEDIIISVLFAFAIHLIANEKGAYRYLGVMLSVIALILTKQIGIAFVLLISAFYFIWTVLVEEKARRWQSFLNFGGSISLIIIAWFFSALWGRYVRIVGVAGDQFDLKKIGVDGVLKLLTGNGTPLQNATCRRFAKALYSVSLSTGIFQVSYVMTMILVLTILFFLYKLRKDRRYQKIIYSYTILFLLGRVGYAFTIGLLYLFCFSDVEMVALASFERYMGSYILGESLVFLFLLLDILDKNVVNFFNIKGLLLILAILTLISSPEKMVCLSPQFFNGEPYQDWRERADIIQYFTEDDSKILLISVCLRQNKYASNHCKY